MRREICGTGERKGREKRGDKNQGAAAMLRMHRAQVPDKPASSARLRPRTATVEQSGETRNADAAKLIADAEFSLVSPDFHISCALAYSSNNKSGTALILLDALNGSLCTYLIANSKQLYHRERAPIFTGIYHRSISPSVSASFESIITVSSVLLV